MNNILFRLWTIYINYLVFIMTSITCILMYYNICSILINNWAYNQQMTLNTWNVHVYNFRWSCFNDMYVV